jgi:hypothetical protein
VAQARRQADKRCVRQVLEPVLDMAAVQEQARIELDSIEREPAQEPDKVVALAHIRVQEPVQDMVVVRAQVPDMELVG